MPRPIRIIMPSGGIDKSRMQVMIEDITQWTDPEMHHGLFGYMYERKIEATTIVFKSADPKLQIHLEITGENNCLTDTILETMRKGQVFNLDLYPPEKQVGHEETIIDEDNEKLKRIETESLPEEDQ